MKQTVEKLDHALARLQEIQDTLRGHSSLHGIAEPHLSTTHNWKSGPKLRRFHDLGEKSADQSEEWRRWSTPAPLMHNAVSEVVAASKFAKKTVDMMKVQRKQAIKSTNHPHYLQGKQTTTTTTLLHPSNRVNLPQPVMAATDEAGGNPKNANAMGSKPAILSKENRRAHHKIRLDLNDDTKVQTKRGLRSSIHVSKQKGRDGASSSSHSKGFVASSVDPKLATAKDAAPKIIQLRTLLPAEEASDHHSPSPGHEASNNRVTHIQYHEAINDHHTHIHGHENFDHNGGHHSHCHPPPAVERSSLSMKALMQSEDKAKSLDCPSQPCVGPIATKNEEDVDLFSSAMLPTGLCVQVEEIKSSRRQSWSFSHGKASNKAVVMFPNPTFDQTITTENVKIRTSNTTTMKHSFNDEACAISKAVVAPPSSARKASFQKKDKMVRLSPCSTSSNAQKARLKLAPTRSSTSPSKRALVKQNWLCTLTQPPSPTLIRRLPEVHEMKGVINQSNAYKRAPARVVPSTTTSSVLIGAPDGVSSQEPISITENEGEKEGRQPTISNHDDDDKKTLRRSWSVSANAPAASHARRSSLGPSGHFLISSLSKHFHAWKLASKQEKA